MGENWVTAIVVIVFLSAAGAGILVSIGAAFLGAASLQANMLGGGAALFFLLPISGVAWFVSVCMTFIAATLKE